MTLTERAFYILLARIEKTSARFDAYPNAIYNKEMHKALQPLYETYDRIMRRARINNERRKK